jgi:hypothetical protein
MFGCSVHLLEVFISRQLCILFIDVIIEMEICVIWETKPFQCYGVIAIYRTKLTTEMKLMVFSIAT